VAGSSLGVETREERRSFYFDNDEKGYAPINALRLDEMIAN
jgi:hypothetical protein